MWQTVVFSSFSILALCCQIATQQLEHTLKFSNAQSGVVGLSGMEFTVTPSGEWTKTQFWGKRRREKATGKLSPQQLVQVATFIQQSALPQLDESIWVGDRGKNANPKILKVEYGKIKRSIYMPAGTKLAEHLKQIEVANDKERLTALQQLNALLIKATGSDHESK